MTAFSLAMVWLSTYHIFLGSNIKSGRAENQAGLSAT